MHPITEESLARVMMMIDAKVFVATVLDAILAILMLFGLCFSDDGGDKAIKPVQLAVIALLIYNIWLLWL